MLKLKGSRKVLLRGLIISSLASASLIMTSYASSPIPMETSSLTSYVETFPDEAPFNFRSYIQGFDFLSEVEKQQLLKTYEQTKPLYNEIDRIYDEIEVISNRDSQRFEELYKEIDEIYKRRPELWDKLFNNVSEEQNGIMDEKKFIQASEALNAEGKQILLKDQGEIDRIYKKLDEEYDRLERDTEGPYQKIDNIYKKIVTIDEKDEGLWQKIYENDTTTIPYR